MKNKKHPADAENDAAKEVLDQIMASIPVDIVVDFDEETVTKTFKDGRKTVERTEDSQPRYELTLKKSIEKPRE